MVSLRVGFVVLESRHPRIAYRADAIGVKIVQSSAGDGCVNQNSLEGGYTIGRVKSLHSVTLYRGSKILKESSVFLDSSASRREIKDAVTRW